MIDPPTLRLTSAHVGATAYRFSTTSQFPGWAICTVNDVTGELLITSDWGSWSYRWNTRALGERSSLTAFIGDRSPGGIGYLADKLQGVRDCEFSAEKTVAALRRRLADRRLEDGREQLEGRLDEEDLEDGKVPGFLSGKYDEHGLPLYGGHHVAAPTWSDPGRTERLLYLTRTVARRIWDELGEVADDVSGGMSAGDVVFFERVAQIDGFTDYVTDCAWDYLETARTNEDVILRDAILPALVAACSETVRSREMARWFVNGPQSSVEG